VQVDVGQDLLPPTVDIRPSIGWILKNIANPRTIGFAPENIVRDLHNVAPVTLFTPLESGLRAG
jgi:hypothetical protein